MTMIPRSPIRQLQQQHQQQQVEQQPQPTTIMRRGRFVAPIAAGIVSDTDGIGPPLQHPHYYYPQQFNPYDNCPSYQYYQQPQQYQQQQQHQDQRYQQVLSPTSQVRFEDEQRLQQQWGAGDDEYSPSFLFEEGEWSVSEADGDDNDTDGNDTMSGGGVASPVLPSEAQLTLLCLDYLRDLRRSYQSSDDLRNAEGLDADYIALAAWSLSRAFVEPKKLRHADPKLSVVTETTKTRKGGVERMIQTHYLGGGGLEGGDLNDEPVGNDAWYRQLDDEIDISGMDNQSAQKMFDISDRICIPPMKDITNEVLLRHPKESAREESSEDEDEPYYEHNDGHFSNAHRFFLLNGLASSVDGAGGTSVSATPIQGGLMTPRGFFPRGFGGGGGTAAASTAFDGSPLTMTSIISAGLMALRAKSRIDAEKEMVSSPLFHQFVHAASAGGFFQEKRDERERGFKSSPSTPKATPSIISEGINSMKSKEETDEEKEYRSRLMYESKYRKVVNKFRQKLAAKDATQLLTPQQTLASQSPRVNTAYRIMSGNASVSSGGGGASAEWNVLNYVLNATNVVEQQQRRRERRIERVKLERVSDNECPLNKDENNLSRSPHRSVPQDCPPPENRIVQQFKGKEEEEEEEEEENKVPPSSSLTTQPKIPPSPSKATASTAVAKLPHYQEAERLNSAGNALMQQKQFQQALETYTSAIKLAPAGPNSHVYFSNRSAAYLSLNEHERSIRDCEYSLALKPEFAKAHSRLGLAYFASGRYQDAVAAYQSSLELDPNNAWSLDHLEKAQGKLRESLAGTTKNNKEKVDTPTKGIPTSVQDSVTEEAWPTPFDEVKKQNAEVASDDAGGNENLSPNDTMQERFAEQTSQANHHKDQGNKHMSNKEYEKALHEYNLAIQISSSGPNSHVYYSNRAAAHCYLADYAAATADFQTSIALNPSYEKAHSRLGLSLFFRGEYEAAIEAYNKSLELDPTNRASLSYLVKSKARLAEQQVVQEESKRKEEEDRERNRERMDRLGKQRQYQQQQKQQEHAQQTPPRVAGDREASNQGDVAGNTTSGLTPNGISDSYGDDPRKPSALATIEEDLQAFDPFSTTDD